MSKLAALRETLAGYRRVVVGFSGGVDSAFSLEPWELELLVESTRVAQLSLGEPVIGPKQAEQNVLRFRRSLFVTQDVRAGDLITFENVRSIRPAGGLARWR